MAIASLGRSYLYTALCNVVNYGYTVMYCDTDSLFVYHPDNIDPSEMVKGGIYLGHNNYWTKCDGTYSKAVFVAPKMYYTVDSATGAVVTKAKGISKSVQLTEQQFLDLIIVGIRIDVGPISVFTKQGMSNVFVLAVYKTLGIDGAYKRNHTIIYDDEGTAR